MNDRFHSGNVRRRMREYGAESIDGELPADLRQPYRRRELSKAELRAQLAKAMANTAQMTIHRIKPKGTPK
jgi:hypothetical protein